MHNAVLPSGENNPIVETHGKNIINGFKDSEFDDTADFLPENKLLREEAVKIIVNARTYINYIKKDRVIVEVNVKDGQSDKPVSDARVMIYGPNNFFDWKMTDRDGRCEFKEMLKSGNYYICSAKGGYQSYNGSHSEFSISPGDIKNKNIPMLKEEDVSNSNITDVTVSETYHSASISWKKPDENYPFTEIIMNQEVKYNHSGTSCTISNLDMGTEYTLMAYSHDNDGNYAYTQTTIKVFTHLGGELKSNRILSKKTYIVDIDLTIPKELKLITQNANLNFNSGRSLLVHGSIDSQQTTFSSNKTEKAAGQWNRIVFYPESSGEMVDCKVEYAGGALSGTIEINNARLRFTNGRVENVSGVPFKIHMSADVHIENSYVENSTYHGIEIDGTSSPAIINNTINNCTYPIWLTYQNNSPVIKGNQFSGSTQYVDAILTQGTITQPAIWQDTTEVWDDAITIAKDAALKIMPGTTISFKDGSSHLLIYGKLIADGNSKQKILFTSDEEEKAAGQWGRIIYYPYSSGIMNHCIVEYAGAKGYGTIDVDNASLHIENSQIRKINGIGIKISRGALVTAKDSLFFEVQNQGIDIDEISNPSIVNNVFNDCNYPIRLHYKNNFPLIRGNQYINSKVYTNAALVSGTMTRSGIWYDPVDLTGEVIIAQGVTLEIKAGNKVFFDNSSSNLTVKGKLVAKAIPTDQICFTSDEVTGKKEGQWGKISFSPGSQGIISNCVIEYASGPAIETNYAIVDIDNSTFKDISTTGVNIKNMSDVSVKASEFRNNTGRGIEIDGSSSPSILNNKFVYCGYPIYLTYDSNFPLIKDNIFAGSKSWPDAILVNGTIRSSGSWFDPISVHKAVNISSGANLNVREGNLVTFNTSKYLSIYGSLEAIGSSQKPTIFTSEQDEKAPGQWDRINFKPGSSGQIKHCVIEYSHDNIINMDNAYLVFENNEVRHNQRYSGLSVSNNSKLVLKNSVLAYMPSHGVYTNKSILIMNNNYLYKTDGVHITGTFDGSLQSNYFNGSTTPGSKWGVQNVSGVLVDASQSWWGDASGPYAAGCNEEGKGDKINNCNTINYADWLSEKTQNYPPGTITDLTVTRTSNEKANVKWKAMGDDGAAGTVDHFDLRYCHEMITDKNWDDCTSVKSLPSPQESGTVHNSMIRELNPETDYYFAIRSTDAAGLQSGISNIAILPAIDMKKVIQLLDNKEAGIKGKAFNINWFENNADITYLNLFYKTDPDSEWQEITKYIGDNDQNLWDKWTPDFVDDTVWFRIEAFDQSDDMLGWDESEIPQEINQEELIQLVSPNGTEDLIINEPFEIKWASQESDATVSIYLLTRDGYQTEIISQAENSGSFSWTPVGIQNDVKIKIFLNDNKGNLLAYDESDGFFEIQAIQKDLELLTPNGLEVFRPGDTINVAWSLKEAEQDEQIFIYLISSSGQRYDYPSTDNHLTQNCRLPENIMSTQWKFCVESSNTRGTDCSDQNFTILSANLISDISDDTSNCNNVPGDANLNGIIDLRDIIINLQTVTGIRN